MGDLERIVRVSPDHTGIIQVGGEGGYRQQDGNFTGDVIISRILLVGELEIMGCTNNVTRGTFELTGGVQQPRLTLEDGLRQAVQPIFQQLPLTQTEHLICILRQIIGRLGERT